jgi:hypothetical protein
MKKEGCGRELQKMRRQNESHKGGAVRRANRQIPEMQEVRPRIQDRRGISVLTCARFFFFFGPIYRKHPAENTCQNTGFVVDCFCKSKRVCDV